MNSIPPLLNRSDRRELPDLCCERATCDSTYFSIQTSTYHVARPGE